MNWVPVARHGLILWENEATGSRKVSRYLPGLWDTIFLSKMSAEIPKPKNPELSVYLHSPDVSITKCCLISSLTSMLIGVEGWISRIFDNLWTL